MATRLPRPLTRMRPRRSPARSEWAEAPNPARRPFPAVARPTTSLLVSPVSPDLACAFESAPELSDDLAAPAALASPVRPESPESPDSASPCGVLADNNDVLLSVTFALASPVVPVLPELPEMATGLASAVEVAGPVSPVLVADDWAIAAPESPLIAVGDESSSASPPSPPFALTSAMESPPARRPTLTRLPRPVTAILALTSPARPDLALPRNPPTPPLPPIAVPRTVFAASPVSPDLAAAEDWAPELALESAEASTDASPVRPESPDSPASADASVP